MSWRAWLVGIILLAVAGLVVAWKAALPSVTHLSDVIATGRRPTFVVSDAIIEGETLILDSAQPIGRDTTSAASDLAPFAARTLVVVRRADDAESLLQSVPELLEFDGQVSESDFVYDMLASVKVDWREGDVEIVSVSSAGIVRSRGAPKRITRIVFRRDMAAEKMIRSGFSP